MKTQRKLIDKIKLHTSRTRENHPVRSIQAFSKSGRLVRMKTFSRFTQFKTIEKIFAATLLNLEASKGSYEEIDFESDMENMTQLLMETLKS